MTIQELKSIFASGTNVLITKTITVSEKTVIETIFKGKFRSIVAPEVLRQPVLIVENQVSSSKENFAPLLVIRLK